MEALIKLDSKDFYGGEKVGVIELENQQKYDIYQDISLELKYYSLENVWIELGRILNDSDLEKLREGVRKLLFNKCECSWIRVEVLN